MQRQRTRPAAWAACLAAACVVLPGCAGSGGGPGTRRGVEREYLSTPDFGAPIGIRFEDIVPVGARITEVHVASDERVNAVWLSYERNGKVRQTPRRGRATGTVETLRLGRNEKLIGLHAYGGGTIDELVVATSRRTVSFGDGQADGLGAEEPWFASLSPQQRRDYVGVGITGRADDRLRQLSLRLQDRSATTR